MLHPAKRSVFYWTKGELLLCIVSKNSEAEDSVISQLIFIDYYGSNTGEI